MSDPRPTDALWIATVATFREAGWEGDEPGDIERMFWAVGFKQGAATAHRHSTVKEQEQ